MIRVLSGPRGSLVRCGDAGVCWGMRRLLVLCRALGGGSDGGCKEEGRLSLASHFQTYSRKLNSLNTEYIVIESQSTNQRHRPLNCVFTLPLAPPLCSLSQVSEVLNVTAPSSLYPQLPRRLFFQTASDFWMYRRYCPFTFSSAPPSNPPPASGPGFRLFPFSLSPQPRVGLLRMRSRRCPRSHG